MHGESLLRVSFEILDMIARELPPPSRVALALSCKAIIAVLTSTRAIRNLNRREIIEALQLLERDTPGHFLCFGCLRLCPWKPGNRLRWRGQAHEKCGGYVKRTSLKYRARKRGDGPLQFWPAGGYPLRCIFFPLAVHRLAWKPRTEGPVIFLSEAYQVMNRHRLGHPFGLPLESLERQFYCERYLTLDKEELVGDHFSLQKFTHGRRPLTRHRRDRIIDESSPESGIGRDLSEPSPPAQLWKFYHEYKAKIIDGELFICRIHRLTGPPVASWRFTKLLHDLALPVCQHLFTRTKPPASFGPITTQPEREYPRTATHLPLLRSIPHRYFSPSEPTVGSCDTCFTDYVIYITVALAGKRDWQLELTTYHRLGSCSSPDDPVWSVFTSFAPHLWAFRVARSSRQSSSRKYGLGDVRKHWYNDEQFFQQLPGKWAGWDQDSVPFHWTGDIGSEDWRGVRSPELF